MIILQYYYFRTNNNVILMYQFASLLLILAGIIYLFGQCHNNENMIVFNKNKLVDGVSQLHCYGGTASTTPLVRTSCHKICNEWHCIYDSNNVVMYDIKMFCNNTCRLEYKLDKKIAKKSS